MAPTVDLTMVAWRYGVPREPGTTDVRGTRIGLPIIRHPGFPVAILPFNFQIFRRKDLKLIFCRRFFLEEMR